MGILSIGVFPGLVGNMTYDFALRFAEAAKDKGHEVNIWFSGNATGSVKANQKHLKDYSTGEQHIKRLLEKGVAIFLVIKHGLALEAVRFCLPQDDGKSQSMKGPDEATGNHGLPEEMGEALPHLPRRTLRESYGRDGFRIYPLFLDEVSDAPRQRPCLSRTRTRHHEQRPVPMLHRSSL